MHYSQDILWLQVGKLHLAVDTLEETLNSLDASTRLSQHEAHLQQLHSSHEQLQTSLEMQTGAQDGRLLGLQAQLAAAQEGVEEAHVALGRLNVTVEQHPSQWQAEAEGLVAPLREKLGQQESEVQGINETLAAFEAGAASGDATLGALREEVAGQPAKWAAAVEAATGPLQEQLASLEAKQSEDGTVLQASEHPQLANGEAGSTSSIAPSNSIDDLGRAYGSGCTTSSFTLVEFEFIRSQPHWGWPSHLCYTVLCCAGHWECRCRPFKSSG